MRVVLQRVSEAAVQIDGVIQGQIGQGLLVLVGIENTDSQEDIDWLVKKISKLRIFADEDGLMNLSLLDINGEILVISQFTLHARTKKGNRPSYISAAPPTIAIPLYENFKTALGQVIGRPIQAGIFGADMKVSLINDGPVTISIDSKAKA
jgi:D-tyrosyl-tRNA(Tyr) deacylase